MGDSYELQQEYGNTPEVNEVIEDSRRKWKPIEKYLKKIDDIRRSRIRNIDFGRNYSNIPEYGRNIILKLREKFKDDESIDGVIFNNLHVQKLLADVVSDRCYDFNILQNNINEDGINIIEGKEANTLDSGDIDSDINFEESVIDFDSYILRESSQSNFEEFLLSNEGIAVLSKTILSYIDTSTGELYQNYHISEGKLKMKLRNAWNNKMRAEYNLNNGIYSRKEKDDLETISNVITNDTDNIVSKYLKEGGEDFNKGLIEKLESLFSKKTGDNSINKILSDIKNIDTFQCLLKDNIKQFSSYVVVDNNINLDTGDSELNLQLKSYLFIYGKFFYPSVFETNRDIQYYDKVLPMIMDAILFANDKKIKSLIKENKFIELEREAEKKRIERDKKRRQEAAKRNIELNNKLKKRGNKNNQGNEEKLNDSNTDPNNLTGVEIARKYLNMSDFAQNKKSIEINSEDGTINKKILNIARKSFISKHDELKEIFTINDISNLYDIKTNSINDHFRKRFVKTDIMKLRSENEINEIYKIIITFPQEFNIIKDELEKKINTGSKNMDYENVIQATGTMIESVVEIFRNIVKKWGGNTEFEGFKFNKEEPVKRSGNNIIISGKFNGTDIIVRYDLFSGNLFMNSYVQHPDLSTTIIGSNTAGLKIGQIEPFSNIINKHFNQENSHKNIVKNRNVKREFSEMLNNRIDLIGERIVDSVRSQSIKNSVITKFMRTFNILLDNQEANEIEFRDGSNLFDLLQLIENSDAITLEKFQTNMVKIFKCSGLIWGSNNILGPQNNQYSEEIFNQNNKNEYVVLLRDNNNDFLAKLETLKGKKNFNDDFQLGFAQIIIDNFTNGDGKPNRRLDSSKMDEFMDHIEEDNKKENL